MSAVEANRILGARVEWIDGFENPPGLALRALRRTEYGPYEKRPTGGGEAGLSDEQAAIVGGPPDTRPGWHVYRAVDGPFVTMFTYGGKPDRGFGGHTRTIQLVDGTEETVSGGWHPSAAVSEGAGFEPVIPVSIFRDAPSWQRGYTAMAGFALLSACEEAVATFCPGVEWVDGSPRTFKWRGQPTKAEWRASERARIKEYIAAEYGPDARHPLHDNQAEIRPYSLLGPKGE